MEEVTLGDIQNVIVWLITFIGAILTIVKAVKKVVDSAFEPMAKKIDDLQTNLTAKIAEVDMNATKNYLVQTLAEIDRNGYIDGVSKARFYEQYEHYIKGGGNSFVKEEFQRMKKEGKL